MALTIRKLVHSAQGSTRVRTVSIDLDAAYPTGGYPFDPSKANLGGFHSVYSVSAGPRNDFSFEWDPTTRKLLVRVANTGVEAAAALAGLAAIKDLRVTIQGV